jgi:hypothetical protein
VNPKLFSLRALLPAVLLCTSLAARADITIYTDRAAFLAAITATATDSFDDLPFGPAIPLDRSTGPYSYRVTSFRGAFVTGAADDKWLTNSVGNNPLFFQDFTGGTNAVGGNFFGTDFDGKLLPNATIELLAQDQSGYVLYTLDHPTADSFVGFISDVPITIIGVLDETDGEFATANNLTLGMASPAPEPASAAMLLAGMAAFGLVARRRR